MKSKDFPFADCTPCGLSSLHANLVSSNLQIKNQLCNTTLIGKVQVKAWKRIHLNENHLTDMLMHLGKGLLCRFGSIFREVMYAGTRGQYECLSHFSACDLILYNRVNQIPLSVAKISSQDVYLALKGASGTDMQLRSIMPKGFT